MPDAATQLTGIGDPLEYPIKLLIIDDTELDRKLFAATLKSGTSFSYEILEASDIESGLALCASERPDCVLLDYMLRGESGIDWIAESKARAGNPHMPVIMLTGAGDEALAVSAFHAGAADYLPKAKANAPALERAIGNGPLVNIFQGQPWALPLKVRMLERHPLSSQAFVPLGRRPFLVVVAPPGDRPQPGQVRAFLAENGQGVNYRRGVWHHPLVALDEITDFLVIDRGGKGENCDEVNFPEGADALVVTLP